MNHIDLEIKKAQKLVDTKYADPREPSKFQYTFAITAIVFGIVVLWYTGFFTL